jgi:Kef-type K+ transport system membrane component KefB
MELTILKDIVIIFALSTFVNLLFTALKIPTVVGYLITGMVAGPYLLGLVADMENIEALAEVGVIFLLFTIRHRTFFKASGKDSKNSFFRWVYTGSCYCSCILFPGHYMVWTGKAVF